MGYKRSRKKRRNVEEEEVDRLSSLPDDLIHKIFSFIGIKPAIETSVLSSRWRFVWTSMPCLDFSSEDFSTLPKFSKFVTQFLSRRNNQIEVSSLDLSFRGKVTQPFVKKLLDYAYSHNIQQLNVSYTPQNYIEIPLSLFSSQSLKHLSFTLVYGYKVNYLPTTSTLELPGLTTLYLHGLTLCCDNNSDNCIALFSKCPNLKNLILSSCRTIEQNNFSIYHPQLSNLTLKNGPSVKVVNVVAPQLENLIIRSCSSKREHVISAPNLTSLVYDGIGPLHLSTDGFHSLKEADICVSDLEDVDAHQIVCMFQQFHNVKFLKLNLEIVEFLSSCVELISHQPSPFVNLNSLTIYPKRVWGWDLPKETVTVSAEVEHYLLDSSPGATFMMVSREEMIAKTHMAQLRVLLGEEKANTKTREVTTIHDNWKVTRREKAPMETNIHEQGKSQPETKIQLQFTESMAQIKSCWKDLSVDIKQRKAKVFLIISELQEIEKLLKKLPASRRALIQPCFSSLCAETNIVMNKIADCMKIQCDENLRRIGVCFHEAATTVQSSS